VPDIFVASSKNPPAMAKKRFQREEKPITLMSVLTTKQVGVLLKTVPNWSKRDQTIVRTFQFEGFLKGITFVNRIAGKAQKCNHHPDIDISFDKVTLALTTREEGGITEKDFFLARQCDEILSKYFAPWLARIPSQEH
jgi:4a-hydroxytetrahydrobiopterin dehydratase